MKEGELMGFTFKKHKKEGRYRSFERDMTDIKLKRKACGLISEIDFDKYCISFAVKREPTGSDPAPFKWIYFKKIFKNETKARAAIKKFEKEIQEKYNLHFFED